MSKSKTKKLGLLIASGIILLIVAIYFVFIRVHVPHKPEKHGSVYSLLTETYWEDNWSNTLSFSTDGKYYYHYDGSPVDASDLTPNYSFDEKNRSIRVYGDIFLFNFRQKITYIDPNYLVLTRPLPDTSAFMKYNPDLPDSFRYALEDNWIFVQVHKLEDGKITIAPYNHGETEEDSTRYISQFKLKTNWKCYMATSEDYGKEIKELPLLSGDERKALIKEHSTALVRFTARGKISEIVFFDLVTKE